MFTPPVGVELCRPGLAGLFPASLAAGYSRQHSPWAGKAAWVLQGSATGRQSSQPEPTTAQNQSPGHAGGIEGLVLFRQSTALEAARPETEPPSPYTPWPHPLSPSFPSTLFSAHQHTPLHNIPTSSLPLSLQESCKPAAIRPNLIGQSLPTSVLSATNGVHALNRPALRAHDLHWVSPVSSGVKCLGVNVVRNGVGGDSGPRTTKNRKDTEEDKKSRKQRQLSLVYAQLRDELPSFFHTDMDYSVYHPSVRFEETVTSLHIRFNGLKLYKSMMNTIRKATLVCFPDVQLNIMSITKHPDQMEIRVRWQTVATRWSAKVYLDAYSIFKVDDTGAIVEHKCNKVMQDYQFVPQRRPLFWGLLGLSNQPAGPMPACSTPPFHFLACDF
eukprot:comp21435_c0_seq1/m.29562 comp21435_c0_seq1/g.29562  ORF comp21435_c0_seq1/g.29562 comp21435_c0_seq1/m.29562 type:complete len:386 (-) comp21435_c0_seq1:430-1587(-)